MAVRGSAAAGDAPRDFVTLVPQYCVYCGKALMHEVAEPEPET